MIHSSWFLTSTHMQKLKKYTYQFKIANGEVIFRDIHDNTHFQALPDFRRAGNLAEMS